MAYEQKPNKGTLWPNEYKTIPEHPDVKGDLHLDRDLLKSLMAKHPTGLIKISVSGWAGVAANKKVLNLVAQEPWTGGTTQQSAPADNDELPY